MLVRALRKPTGAKVCRREPQEADCRARQGPKIQGCRKWVNEMMQKKKKMQKKFAD